MNLGLVTSNMGVLLMTAIIAVSNCETAKAKSADDLLGNSNYVAMSYSGWRASERSLETAPTIAETKEDLLLLHAMGIRFIRTYNTQLFPHFERTLQAIEKLKQADADFEMYVMLGAWIQCKGAYTANPDHTVEDAETNQAEIDKAIELAMRHPEIVKVIAVGNEAMVDWQAHFVPPAVIHKYVKQLQAAREAGKLSEDLWITTSDNWAALGGEEKYHNDDLLALLRSLDYLSVHTYAFHDSYYYPTFDWAVEEDADKPLMQQRQKAVMRSIKHQKDQVAAVKAFLKENEIEKEIHIGETGWASKDDSHYGNKGTAAADELTEKLFHDEMRKWTEQANMSCFYFEAFDEPWKSSTVDGSESHFGLFTVDGKAKAVIWHLFDEGVFDGLGRNGKPVTKTFDGKQEALMETVKPPVIFKFQP